MSTILDALKRLEDKTRSKEDQSIPGAMRGRGRAAGTPWGTLVATAAMGGPVALQGALDRPPVRLSVPQVWRHAGGEAEYYLATTRRTDGHGAGKRLPGLRVR